MGEGRAVEAKGKNQNGRLLHKVKNKIYFLLIPILNYLTYKSKQQQIDKLQIGLQQ